MAVEESRLGRSFSNVALLIFSRFSTYSIPFLLPSFSGGKWAVVGSFAARRSLALAHRRLYSPQNLVFSLRDRSSTTTTSPYHVAAMCHLLLIIIRSRPRLSLNSLYEPFVFLSLLDFLMCAPDRHLLSLTAFLGFHPAPKFDLLLPITPLHCRTSLLSTDNK